MDLNVTEGLSAKRMIMLTSKLLNGFMCQGIHMVIEHSKYGEIFKTKGFQQSIVRNVVLWTVPYSPPAERGQPLPLRRRGRS